MNPKELKEMMKKSNVHLGNRRDEEKGYKGVSTHNQDTHVRSKSHFRDYTFKDKLL